MDYLATNTDDNSHQAGSPHSYRDVFSNTKILRTVIIVLSLLVIVLVIVICVITGKNDTCKQKPNDNASNSFQPIRDSERITPLNNDPFCQFPFPYTSVHVMKCFLHKGGEYTVNSIFDTPAQVTRMCATNVTKYHYKLDCASSLGYNCNQVCSEHCDLDCTDDCTEFSITISLSGILVLEISDNCLQNDGYIEIWNATLHRMGKQERQSQKHRDSEHKDITRK
ncbi:unnamed protein product [Mytilus edulis]|uniref:Uncharacterized protein n=1 Tax=Mytilus edulis TaxID=6550 RepID=A0A8S3SUM3_MYTED|nr:unnamed protein product [Mytilus edulis]